MIVTLARGLLYSTLSNTPQQIAEKALAATVFLDMQDRNGVPLNWGSVFFSGIIPLLPTSMSSKGQRKAPQNW